MQDSFPKNNREMDIESSSGTSAPYVDDELIAEIDDWFLPDMAKLKEDAFALALRTQFQGKLTLALHAPKYLELQRFIQTQVNNNKNPDIAAEQLQALEQAKSEVEATEKWGALLLVHVTRHFGLRRALKSCGFFLHQRLMKIISSLASYQVADGKVVCPDFTEWFDRHHALPTIAQAVYGCSQMLEVIVGEDSAAKEHPETDTVFLPLDQIESTGSGDLFTNLPESAVHLREDLWINYVVPQLTAMRAASIDSYHAWTPDETTYLTEGILWEGNERLHVEGELIEGTDVLVVQRGSYRPPDAANEARQYLESLTDPPVKPGGPFRFFPPGTDLERIKATGTEILNSITAVDEKTWRAPSVWHAAAWLMNNAGGVAEDKEIRSSFPNIPPAIKFAGPLLFKAGTNSEADLQLRLSVSAEEGQALVRLMLALNSLNERAGLPSVIIDAIVGVTQDYGLSTYLLPVTLDPLVAIRESIELAGDNEAAVYWTPLHKIDSLGGRLILPPIWAESLYDKKEVFLDFRDVGLAEVKSECWKLLFPIERAYLDFEFPPAYVKRSTSSDDLWLRSAGTWARNSKTGITPDVDQKADLFAAELCSHLGQPPFAGATTQPKLQECWSIRLGNLMKWLMLKRGERGFYFDCYTTRLLSKYTYGTLSWFAEYNDRHQHTLGLSLDYAGSEAAKVAQAVSICLQHLQSPVE